MSDYLYAQIDGERLDLEKLNNFPFTLDYGIEALENIGRPTGFMCTNVIELPGTAPARKVFQRYHDPRPMNEDATELKRATIMYKGVPMFHGQAWLMRAITEGDTYRRADKGFVIGLMGNNAEWINPLRDIHLCDIPLADHIFDKQTIANGWYATPSQTDYGYTLIKFKAWNNPSHVEYQEFTPFLVGRWSSQEDIWEYWLSSRI